MIFTKHYLSSLLATFQLLAVTQYAHAVCAPGQMAVGTEVAIDVSGFSGGATVYAGFLMANNCGLISQNGLTADSNQMCNGGYSKGASVTCSGNEPIAAVDTQGQSWTCSQTSDTSCNEGYGVNNWSVVACCNRD